MNSLGYGYIIYDNPGDSSVAQCVLNHQFWYDRRYSLEFIKPNSPLKAGTGNILCEFSRIKKDVSSIQKCSKLGVAFRPSTEVFSAMLLPTFRLFAKISRATTIESRSSAGVFDNILEQTFALPEFEPVPSKQQAIASHPSSTQEAVTIQGPAQVTAEDVENAAEYERREMIGNYLYPYVRELYPELVYEITDILLLMHMEEQLELMDYPHLIKLRAEQAMDFWTELQEENLPADHK